MVPTSTPSGDEVSDEDVLAFASGIGLRTEDAYGAELLTAYRNIRQLVGRLDTDWPAEAEPAFAFDSGEARIRGA